MALINQKEWDVETTTVGDYSIDMKLTEEQINHFKDHHYDEGGRGKQKNPFGFAFKNHLKDELENKLSKEVPS